MFSCFFRELYGVVLSQRRNDAKIDKNHMKNIQTSNKNMTEDAIRDLLVATITLKYTQSNSVGYSIRGQMIGVGAGNLGNIIVPF
jgi:phosphoribosylaminoimidazolecarboxamide formyltransferase/IMP cyclohydrolase